MLQIVRRRPLAFDCMHYYVYKGVGDPDNVVVDHTGWTVRAQLRENKVRPGKKELKVIANLNAFFPVESSGAVAIRHDEVFTRALKTQTDLWFDIVGLDPDGVLYPILPPTPAEIVNLPTDPYDNSSNDFIPGGGGAVYHTHPFSQITGFQTGITAISIDADGRLHVVKSGTDYAYVPFSITP